MVLYSSVMKKCPECSSEKVIKNALIQDYAQGGRTMIVVHQKPDALILKQAVYSDTRAELCGDCGYVQKYAENPQTLWYAYQTSISDVE